MKPTKKIFTLFISVIVLLGALILCTCAKTLRITTWTGAVTISYGEEAAESSGDTGTICVRKTADGGNIFSFVSVPLSIEFFANEIV